MGVLEFSRIMRPPDLVAQKLEESRREGINVKTKMLDERLEMLRSSDNIIKEEREVLERTDT